MLVNEDSGEGVEEGCPAVFQGSCACCLGICLS